MEKKKEKKKKKKLIHSPFFTNIIAHGEQERAPRSNSYCFITPGIAGMDVRITSPDPKVLEVRKCILAVAGHRIPLGLISLVSREVSNEES